MDATILTVLGTGLTAIGTGVALFVALWRVQGNRFDAVDRRFDMAEELNRERFEMAEKLNRERFEAMDRRWTERFDMAENANRERFGAAESANRRTLRSDGPAVRHGRKAEPGGPRGHLQQPSGRSTSAWTTCTGICSARRRRPTCPAPLPPPDSPRRSADG